MGGFDESQHPRDQVGKFSDGGGGSSPLNAERARLAAHDTAKAAVLRKQASTTGAGSKVPLRGNIRANNLSFQQRIHATRTAALRSK